MINNSKLRGDRYHSVMAKHFLGPCATSPDGSNLGDKEAVFYITQRKVPYTVMIGHDELCQSLFNSQLDVPRMNWLEADRADLTRLTEALQKKGSFLGSIRLAPEGTIMFAGEPMGDVSGPLWNIQLYEVNFEHAFDLPMTVAYVAMEIRDAAGEAVSLSVFSLRRDDSNDRSMRVSQVAIICGFNDTSQMEAAFLLGVDSVGTMAHYLVQAYIQYQLWPERDENGKPKHFETTAFERWLDDNPKGTVVLIDTIDYRYGIIHAIKAALSSEARKAALKAVRIDSGDLIKCARYCRKLLDANGLPNVGIILTGDLDADKIREIVGALDFPIQGFGIGTKLAAEAKRKAGVIFKMCLMAGIPVEKLSGTSGKETSPGRMQVWRCVDGNGDYVKDIVAFDDEPKPVGSDFADAFPILQPFWGKDVPLYQSKTTQQLQEYVKEQRKHFKVPLDQYRWEYSARMSNAKSQVADAMRDTRDYSGEIKGLNEAMAEIAK